MVANPPADTPRVSPYLLYEDVEAALDWLTKAFGFVERARIEMPEGGVGHAEMTIDDGLIMMGYPGPTYKNPKHLGASTQHTYVYVGDVDAHYARAKAAGANIFEEPADQFYGDRRYGAHDPEGHMWFFATHTRDVPPDEMRPPS